MNRNTAAEAPPGFWSRIHSVWRRHVQVYSKHLISNGFPAFVEPLMFLLGIGIGLGHYVGLIQGTSYIQFLAAGILAPSAMFTAAFECSFATFIRLEFDRVYDGMIAAPLAVSDVFIGEMVFAGSKGLFFTFAVMTILYAFGLIPSKLGLLTPVVGFFTGVMFAALALWVTSIVQTINHFNFFITGMLTPMFFFSGIVFPLSDLPPFFRFLAELSPLTHAVRFMHALCFNRFTAILWGDLLFTALFTAGFGHWAIRRLERRMIR